MIPPSETRPAVKICGLTRHEDATVAVEAGARYLGVVMVPESPRAVTVDDVGRIREGIDVPLVLVTADRDPEEVARDARAVDARGVQLHGDESPEDVARLRESGEWQVWKAIRVRAADDLARAIDRFAGRVDALHLDGWHPSRRGGTGVRFPWDEVARIRDRLPDDVALVAAGGLTPENVGRVVDLLRPDVVDVSSGVEVRPGIKDPEKIRAFIHSATGVTTP